MTGCSRWLEEDLSVEMVYWIVLPFVVAAGSAVLGSIVTHARMQVTLVREREALVEARTTLALAHKTAEQKIKTAEASIRQKALDEFLGDVRVEERHYIRERRTPSDHRKCLILQERLYFRNIPLSTWVEHEMTIEEGTDTDGVVRGSSAFAPAIKSPEPHSKTTGLLR